MPIAVVIGRILSPASPAMQEADREQLQERLPFGEPRHRHADAQLGEIFAQARHQDLAAQDDDRGPQREPLMVPSAASISRQDDTSSLSAIGSSMRPKLDCWP